MKKMMKLMALAAALLCASGAGATDDFYADTDGNFHISSLAGLKAFRDDINAEVNPSSAYYTTSRYEGHTVYLDDDIDLKNEEWTPIWTRQNHSFAKFDGQNHTIKNLYISESTIASSSLYDCHSGFFAAGQTTTIQNLTIDGANVTGYNHVGVIAGYAICGHYINCHVKNATVTARQNVVEGKLDNGDKAGAICGYLSSEGDAEITNCSAENCTIIGYRDIGGLAGIANSGNASVAHNTVSKCHVYCGVGYNYKGYSENSGFDGGEIAGEITAGTTISDNTVTDVTVHYPVAQITFSGDEHETRYATLAAAVTAAEAAEAKQTVILLADTSVSPSMSITKTLTLDLNGHKINSEGATTSWAQVTGGATLTITGTTAGSAIYGRLNLGKAGNDNGSVVIDGGTYACGSGQTVLHINGECLNSNVTIQNAAITSADDNGIQLNGKGTFVLENSTFTGATGIYIKAGDTTITGCTITGNKTPVDYSYNGNGANPTGDGIVVDACEYPGGNPTVKISNTMVTGTKKAIGYYQYDGDKDGTIEGSASINSDVNTYTIPDAYKWTAPAEVTGYNYTLGTPVASITVDGTTTYYTTLDAAVTAAQNGGTIVVLDTTVEVPTGYKFVPTDGVTTLVACTYVAQIGEMKYETLAAAIAAVPTTGAQTTITMIADTTETIDAQSYTGIKIESTQNIVLDLNGKVISCGGAHHLITNEGTLEIVDSGDTVVHKFAVDETNHVWVRDETSGTKTVLGGVFTGLSQTGWNRNGGCISNSGTLILTKGNFIGNATTVGNSGTWGCEGIYNTGTFTMNGGRFAGNYLDANGRVVENTGTFTMNAGTFDENYSTSSSAVIWSWNGTFNFNGGLISGPNCKAVSNCSTMTMAGGTISNCVGGVSTSGYIYGPSDPTFTFTSGVIESCTNSAADSLGTALYGKGKVTITMNGGTIRNCQATNGGAVGIEGSDGPVFTMNGGLITGCSNTSAGNGYAGAVYSSGPDSKIIINDGTLANNVAQKIGGAIWSLGSITITGGTFSNNKALGTIAGSFKNGGGAIFFNGENASRTLKITGGTFSGNTVDATAGKGSDVYVRSNYNANLEITGGTFGGSVYVNGDNSLTSVSVTGGRFAALEVGAGSGSTVNTGFVSGGIYTAAPEAELVIEGKEVVDNTDATTKAAYPYMIGNSAPAPAPEVVVDTTTTITPTVVDDSGKTVANYSAQQTAVEKIVSDTKTAVAANTAVKAAASTGVKDLVTVTTTTTAEGGTTTTTTNKTKIVERLQAAAVKTGVATTTTAAAAVITKDSSLSSEIKIKLETAQVVIPTATVGATEATPYLNSVSYDVKPIVTVTVTEGTTTTEVTTNIPNSEITSPITFRLPVTDNTATSAKVTHVGGPDDEGNTWPTEVFTAAVQGTSGNRYVEISASHFSTFIVETSGAIVSDSNETLELQKVTKSLSSANEMALAVPYADTAANAYLVAGFLEDDKIRVWEPTGPLKANYDTWTMDGGAWSPVQKTVGSTPTAGKAIPQGYGAWYSSTATADTKALVLAGYIPVTTPTVSVPAGKQAFLMNPAGTAVDLATAITGASSGDQLLRVGDSQRYQFVGTSWASRTNIVLTIAGTTITSYGPFQATNSIPLAAGQGFWYISHGGAPTINWSK